MNTSDVGPRRRTRRLPRPPDHPLVQLSTHEGRLRDIETDPGEMVNEAFTIPASRMGPNDFMQRWRMRYDGTVVEFSMVLDAPAAQAFQGALYKDIADGTWAELAIVDIPIGQDEGIVAGFVATVKRDDRLRCSVYNDPNNGAGGVFHVYVRRTR